MFFRKWDEPKLPQIVAIKSLETILIQTTPLNLASLCIKEHKSMILYLLNTLSEPNQPAF